MMIKVIKVVGDDDAMRRKVSDQFGLVFVVLYKKKDGKERGCQPPWLAGHTLPHTGIYTHKRLVSLNATWYGIYLSIGDLF